MFRKQLAAAAAMLIIFGLAPAGAGAQSKPLSLEEAIAAGIASSPALHASRLRVEASSARSREAGAGRRPSLKLGGGYARLSEIPPFAVNLPVFPQSIVVSENYFNSFSLRLGVQQPLFTGFRLQASEESARLLERSAGQELEKDRSDFVFAVKTAYWSLARAREIETLVDENIRQVGEHLKDVRAFQSQGLATRNDILRAELELSNAELMKIDARNGAEVALTTLNSLIGWALDTDLVLTTVPASDGARPPGGAWPHRASRPDIRAAEFRILASEQALKASRSGYFPQVQLFGNYSYLRPNPRYMPALDKFRGTWDIGVSLSYDLWDWGRTKSQAEQARARLDQARDALKLLEDQASLEIIQSRLGMERAREKTRVASLAVAQAEENLRLTREMFKQGVASSTDVLDADVALLRAGVNKTQAAIDLELARARLEKALGD